MLFTPRTRFALVHGVLSLFAIPAVRHLSTLWHQATGRIHLPVFDVICELTLAAFFSLVSGVCIARLAASWLVRSTPPADEADVN